MGQLKKQISITILGSGGGVARALLSVLNQAVKDKNDPLSQIIRKAKLHLIDCKQKTLAYYREFCPNLVDTMTLHQLDLNEVEAFKQHLVNTNTKLVVDVSSTDTIEMLSCCNSLGVWYVNTALENTQVDEDGRLYGFPLTERYLRFEDQKSNFTNTKAIVCSGMNPGVVQWMAIHLIQQNPNENPLACYIIEHDTSFYADPSLIKPNTIYSSWSVECFLDEAILCYPMFVSHHVPLYLYEEIYSLEYKVTVGEKQFYGCLMPHEEVHTLGQLYDMETGFIYRVNEYTTELIRNNLANTDKLWHWEQRIIDPRKGEVEGEDLVGVLLVYNGYEKYMYNSMKSRDIFPKYLTNATYFQVACGLYAGIASLLLDSLPLSVYYVDELLLKTNSKYGEYLACHMKHFVVGENKTTDGLLHHRRRPHKV